MFGMDRKGKKKKGAVEDWEFDLEKQLANPAEVRKIKDQAEQRIQQLKNVLRQGENKQTFDNAQTLLHGYLAVQKIIQRVERK